METLKSLYQSLRDRAKLEETELSADTRTLMETLVADWSKVLELANGLRMTSSETTSEMGLRETDICEDAPGSKGNGNSSEK